MPFILLMKSMTLRQKILWLTRPDHVAQAILIFVPFWFGIILFDHVDTFSSSISFDVMEMQMSEDHWALTSLIISSIATICWFSRNIYVMIFQNALLMTWHGLIAICFFLANPHTPATGVYAVLAFGATMRAVNLSLYNQPPKGWVGR